MNPTTHPSAARSLQQRTTAPRGVVLLETVVACVLVLALISVAAPMVVRAGRIWKQTRHFQIATDELSGQLDRLLALPAAQRQLAIDQLQVSNEIADVLHDASLQATIIKHEQSTQLQLSIDWQRIGDPPPVRLVAWIDPLPDAPPETPPEPSSETDSDEATPAGSEPEQTQENAP
ncbi:hypothetical protein NHH03_20965 [Stieleria sp. TO1_6]|uniref:hypothetical protein n=1 Tax=Stieleria tagensis TaxID=2956795 RepID=UPI00209ABA31|nr:hypothetical protein [Stieleria tagensis]MCO8124227.1 hypothetical protein [Stieleria tagensis]